jgi:hypothetical protein
MKRVLSFLIISTILQLVGIVSYWIYICDYTIQIPNGTVIERCDDPNHPYSCYHYSFTVNNKKYEGTMKKNDYDKILETGIFHKNLLSEKALLAFCSIVFNGIWVFITILKFVFLDEFYDPDKINGHCFSNEYISGPIPLWTSARVKLYNFIAEFDFSPFKNFILSIWKGFKTFWGY